MLGYIILAIIIIIILYVISVYNALVRLQMKVNEAFSTMDVYLKKRWDLIPNILESVKGYAKHEKETLEEVIKIRNNAYGDMTNEEKIEANKQISSAVPKIMALAEAYPDLKANENFNKLTDELTKVEEDIANSRKYYNAVVGRYNNKVLMVPSNIVASVFRFATKPMFEIAESERENVKVEF